MAYEDYMKAYRMAQKEFKSQTSKGLYPYLPVLDEILSNVDIENEVNLGVQDISLDQVVGTSTFGRTQAFASNFMPLLEYGSEFSQKWSYLCDAQITEGIKHAIKVYEYMNKYYVEEGNKRVSVLKFFGASNIAAEVIRKVPKRTDDPENIIYYEFMDFYKLSKIAYVQFSKQGSYHALIESLGMKQDHEWTDDDRMDFSSFHTAFYQAYEAKGGNKLQNMTVDDALLFYLSLNPYAIAKDKIKSEIKSELDGIWDEIELLGKEETVELVMDPAKDNATINAVNTVIKNLFPVKKKKIAFVYDKAPSESDWIYGHELGRIAVSEKLENEIETSSFIAEDMYEGVEKMLCDICEDGYDMIFTVTPQLIKASLMVAAKYPNVKIFNCALNSSHNSVITYYTRMYEAKFLTGMIAGAMCKNDRIGYVADYPIFGSTANINAFALGAQMVNPRVKVYLTWSSLKDVDMRSYFRENRVSYISGQDMITPQSPSKRFGLYSAKDKEKKKLAISVYNWGKFYEEIINSFLSVTGISDTGSDNRALNYWWGMSSGVIDVICSGSLPRGTTKLVELIKDEIKSGKFNPFHGPLYNQQNELMCEDDVNIEPSELMTMDWLNNNVIGKIPSIDELEESAKPVVVLRGLTTTSYDKGGATLL